mmetsp:Transcript_30124/g.72804  ORF Transcript_30124/g.72804 Transcript_30124/m.72804 type:complete len:334 (+) Transcript_30124:803-1804(+)
MLVRHVRRHVEVARRSPIHRGIRFIARSLRKRYITIEVCTGLILQINFCMTSSPTQQSLYVHGMDVESVRRFFDGVVVPSHRGEARCPVGVQHGVQFPACAVRLAACHRPAGCGPQYRVVLPLTLIVAHVLAPVDPEALPVELHCYIVVPVPEKRVALLLYLYGPIELVPLRVEPFVRCKVIPLVADVASAPVLCRSRRVELREGRSRKDGSLIALLQPQRAEVVRKETRGKAEDGVPRRPGARRPQVYRYSILGTFGEELGFQLAGGRRPRERIEVSEVHRINSVASHGIGGQPLAVVGYREPPPTACEVLHLGDVVLHGCGGDLKNFVQHI